MCDVPFTDLCAQYDSIRDEIDAAIGQVVASQCFVGGRMAERFETDFARATGSQFVIGVSSGTTALALALEAAGIGEGHEVLVPSLTFAATAEAVCHVGAVPVFVDVDVATMTMSPTSAMEHATKRTRCIVPVHLYGSPCDMDSIKSVAAACDLVIVEDAAQAHLAMYDGKPIGSFGDVAAYSFYPAKNLGAYGDAGAVTTTSPEIARVVRQLRDHGRTNTDTHERIGYSARLDEIQAAVLSTKLRHLASWTDARRRIARVYSDAFVAAGFPVLPESPKAAPSYHLYPIRVEDRDGTIHSIRSSGIDVRVHYPTPLHRQPAFSQYTRPDGDLTGSERVCGSVMSLPMYPEMTDDQIGQVIGTVLAKAVPAIG